MKQVGKFGKSFLILICVMLAATLFTGCPKEPKNSEETSVTLSIKGDWPQGIKSITLVPSDNTDSHYDYDGLTLTPEKKSITVKSSQGWNGFSFTNGTKARLKIVPEEVNNEGYYEYYAWIGKEDEKPQVSVNDTKLTDNSTCLEIDLNTQLMGGTPNLKPTNLITGVYKNGFRNFYTDEFTLSKNNEISYSGLKKIKLEEIKLKDSAGYCYVSAANLAEFDYYEEADYWQPKVITDLKKQGTGERPVSININAQSYYWICETSTDYVLSVYGYENYKLDMTECSDFYDDYNEYKINVNAGPKHGELYKPTEGIKIEKIEDSLLTAKKLVSTNPAIEIIFSEGQKYTATIEGQNYSGVYKYKDGCGTITAELKITTAIGATLGSLRKYGDTWAFYYPQDQNKDPVYFGKVIKINKNIGDVAPGQPFYLGTEFIGFETTPSTRKIHIKGLTDSDYNEEFTVSESSTLELSGDDQLEPGRYVCTVSVEQDGKKYESNSGYLYVKKISILEEDLNVQLGDIATIPIEMLYYSGAEAYYDNPYRISNSPGFYIHLDGEGVKFVTQNPFPVKDGKIEFPTYGFSPTVKDGQLCPVDLWIEDSDQYSVDGGENYKGLASNKVKITLNGPAGTITFAPINGQTSAKAGDEVQMNVTIEGFTMADPWVMVFIQTGATPDISVDDKDAITWHDETLPKYPDRNDFQVVDGKITFTIPEDALPEGQDSATYKLYVWSCGIYSQSIDVTVSK